MIPSTTWDLQLPFQVLVLGVLTLVALGWQFLEPKPLDPAEPPEVKSTIPIFGHIIGLLWHQAEYWTILSKKTSSAAITIRIFGARIYVLCSPELIHRVMGNSKAFSFEPFIIEASRRILNMGEDELRIYGAKEGINGGHSYMHDVHHLIATSLAPGPYLNDMNSKFGSVVAPYFNEIKVGGETVYLYKWIRDILTKGVCAALYGFDNQFSRDPSLIDSLWDFEDDMNMLLMNIFPRFTARKAFLGRERLLRANREYFDAGLWKNACRYLQGRVPLGLQHGFNMKQVAEYESLVTFASVTNSVVVSFWLLNYILADAEITAAIQEEVDQIVSIKTIDGKSITNMDLFLLRSKCPLLVSMYEELLRFTTFPVSTRSVIEETVLKGEYLLKAGGVIQLPSKTTQLSPSVWGPDADTFNPRRFLQKEEKPTQEQRDRTRLQNKAYFPFGGGRNLCPGRHFAQNEVLGFVAAVIYSCSIKNEDGSPIQVLQERPRPLGVAIGKPVSDIKINISRKPGLENVKLVLTNSGGSSSREE